MNLCLYFVAIIFRIFIGLIFYGNIEQIAHTWGKTGLFFENNFLLQLLLQMISPTPPHPDEKPLNAPVNLICFLDLTFLAQVQTLILIKIAKRKKCLCKNKKKNNLCNIYHFVSIINWGHCMSLKLPKASVKNSYVRIEKRFQSLLIFISFTD